MYLSYKFCYFMFTISNVYTPTRHSQDCHIPFNFGTRPQWQSTSQHEMHPLAGNETKNGHVTSHFKPGIHLDMFRA